MQTPFVSLVKRSYVLVSNLDTVCELRTHLKHFRREVRELPGVMQTHSVKRDMISLQSRMVYRDSQFVLARLLDGNRPRRVIGFRLPYCEGYSRTPHYCCLSNHVSIRLPAHFRAFQFVSNILRENACLHNRHRIRVLHSNRRIERRSKLLGSRANIPKRLCCCRFSWSSTAFLRCSRSSMLSFILSITRRLSARTPGRAAASPYRPPF